LAKAEDKMKICTVAEMQQLDQTAMETYAIPETILMENAGLATCNIIAERFEIQKNHFLVVCGSGNNGGDGLVIARKLYSNGASVCLALLASPAKFKSAAQINFKIIEKLGIPIYNITEREQLREPLKNADIIIDAIFGTGLQRKVEGLYSDIIHSINQSSLPCISVDIPSGINGNTGEIMGTAIEANITITYGQPKLGNLFYPGNKNGGKLYVTHISFPPELYDKPELKSELNMPAALNGRDQNGHKGSFSKALFIAGSAHYFGAPYFSAFSFLKSGGGMSYLASVDAVIQSVASHAPEIIMLSQITNNEQAISSKNLNALLTKAQEMDFIVIGPGISLADDTKALILNFVKELNKPLLIDGDGLTAFIDHFHVLANRRAPTILTPHEGEFSRLIQKSTAEIKKDRIKLLKEFSEQTNSFVVLKGSRTLICQPTEEIYINITGNSGMATAGSGDVLCGIIAAMAAHTDSLTEALKSAVFLHGLSGDLAAKELGEHGITASDLIDFTPLAIRHFTENEEKIRAAYFPIVIP
jgi:NAD(P)H-hydrate epimerase